MVPLAPGLFSTTNCCFVASVNACAGTPNLGATDLDTFIRTRWEEVFQAHVAPNLYTRLRTWETADIADNELYEGDLVRALAAIRARVLLLPGATDLYFRVADNEAELPHLRHAELRPIPSIWGHRAGNPHPAVIPADFLFLKTAVREWMEE